MGKKFVLLSATTLFAFTLTFAGCGKKRNQRRLHRRRRQQSQQHQQLHQRSRLLLRVTRRQRSL